MHSETLDRNSPHVGRRVVEQEPAKIFDIRIPTCKQHAQSWDAGIAIEFARNELPENKIARLRSAANEFLAELGLTAAMKPFAARVTYQDSCHLVHGQKVREAPRKLLRAIPGVELVEMPMSEQCCGSAGVYNVTENKTSMELLDLKMDAVKQTRAEIIATANPGCILQLRAGVAMRKTGQEVLHVVELLDRAMQKS